MDALILAGGKGTRLQSVVSDRPKVMAEVNGRPYLTYLFDQLLAANIKRVILCTGYMADYIEDYFGDTYQDLALVYSREAKVLGTGGAIRQALDHIQSESLLVMNGDSYCDVSLKHFREFHHADVSMVLVRRDDTSRYGRVEFDDDSNVTRFVEKDGQSVGGWINAGIYILNRELVESLPADENISLEKEVFPTWIADHTVKGFFCQGKFIDIGLPESYALAGQFFTDRQTTNQRYVALDRDGTIIKQIHYLSDPEQVEILSGAVGGIKAFRSLGLGVIVVTNQSAIGRGYFDENRLAEVHDRMCALLARQGIAVDGIYYCPATPDDNSPDRKPSPGMMQRASSDFGFTMSDCFVVGDKLSDVDLGNNIGAKSILVRTGYGQEVEQSDSLTCDYVADDLYETSQYIKRVVAETT